MPFTRVTRRAALVAANLTTVGAVTAATLMATGDPAPPPDRPAGADCYATDVPLTVEEQRTVLPLPGDDRPAARRFVEAAGFESMVDDLERTLCTTGHLAAATATALDAGAGPWPVVLNDGVCEWPEGTFPDPAAIRCADDPAPGSRAASAPGGNYLSNESMYRTNRLRLGAGLPQLPGGRLHISALVHPDDPGALTSPAFEADRQAVVDQTVALVEAAGRAVAAP